MTTPPNPTGTKPPGANPTVANTTGAHIMAAALARHGVTKIFGQSLPTALILAAPDYGIRQVGYRTENAGAAMADAYARITGQVSVVTAQNGPAAALLVPGLGEAFKASIPVVAIVQDVHRGATDKNAFQELDHFALFSGVSKWIRRVSDASRIDDYIDMAFTAAASRRAGPAVLMVPVDVLDEMAAPQGRQATLGHYPLDRSVAAPDRIAEAADLLAAARAPIVIAGGGVHSARATEELAVLQELGLPVATTVMGKGTVDETHALSLGVVGYFMAKGSRTHHMRGMVIEADVVLLIGNRTNQNGTDSWQLYPKDARYVHIDIDGGEVGRNYEAVRLVGDAKLTLAALTEALEARGTANLASARSDVEMRIAKGRDAYAEDMTALDMDASPLRPERMMRDLDAAIDGETIVVADASYSSIWVAAYLTAQKAGQRFLTPRGLAGLGWGLPFALGAKAARPDAPVICLTGDGGFGHVWGELETARRMNLPVTVIVLNNQVFGYQKHAELSIYGNHTDVVHFQPVDHAAIAHACDCDGVRVDAAEDFAPALAAAINSGRTTVIDVVTDEKAHPPITSFEGKSALNY